MEPDFSLSQAHLAFIGLGLMGGSLALALRGKCAGLKAYDPDVETVNLARQRQIVDLATQNIGEALEGADIIILAAPVCAILESLQAIGDLVRRRAIVMDLGSTKVEIMDAMLGLPERFDPIGGHPMCGKETLGLVNAEAGIFRGAPFALTPLERTSVSTKRLAEELVEATGARPVWLDARTHDRWTAATSHLPYLVAAALTLAVPDETRPMVGSGFRSTTRVAATHPDMMLDVLETNRENLLMMMRALKAQFDQLEKWLENGDYEDIYRALLQSSRKQRQMVGRKDEGASS
jgi:prephenate dehydrogenase